MKGLISFTSLIFISNDLTLLIPYSSFPWARDNARKSWSRFYVTYRQFPAITRNGKEEIDFPIKLDIYANTVTKGHCLIPSGNYIGLVNVISRETWPVIVP
jgi:hypothetical protein